jgi:YspA, cpYpsA-related SLOG family
MTVLVCGSRDWIAAGPIRRELLELEPKITLVVDGAARGADTIGYTIAREMFGDSRTRRFPANWEHYGRAAGSIRNRQMLEFLLLRKNGGDDVLVLAFHKDIRRSTGTRHMLQIAEIAGIETRLITE